jgi:hypothetical protein
MYSIGTAQKRSEEPGEKKELHVAANLETTSMPERMQPAAVANNPLSKELTCINRIEHLLEHLEANSTALVPYGYWNQLQPQAKKSNNWLIATMLGCIWLSTLALAIAYLSYRHSSQIAGIGVVASPSAIPSSPDPLYQQNVGSVDHLVRALVNSSDRLNNIEAAQKMSNQHLQQLIRKMNTEETRTVTTPPLRPRTQTKADSAAVTRFDDTAIRLRRSRTETKVSSETVTASSPAIPVETGVPDSESPLEDPSMKTLPKAPYRVLSIKPTDGAISHKAADGTIDYWLVPRGVFKELSKVVPIDVAADGVVVHNLADGKNYTLTRQGEWRDAEW